MKKCPFCAEEIQDEAIKCRFCGEFLITTHTTPMPKQKWYYTTKAFVIALLFVGPFALPLAWFNPNYKMSTKVSVTILVLVLTIMLTYLMGYEYRMLMEQVNALGLH